MRVTTIRRLVALIVVALSIAACTSAGSGDPSTTSASSSTTTTPIAGDGAPDDASPELRAFWAAFVATAPAGDVDQQGVVDTADRLCVGLELMQAAGTPPGHAADAIARVLLAGLSESDKARFGTILAIAPSTMCDQVDRYAESVAYWLGF